MIKHILFLAFTISAYGSSFAQNSIIPIPVEVKNTQQHFELKSTLTYKVNSKDKELLEYVNNFKTILSKAGIVEGNSENSLQIDLTQNTKNELGKEGYILEIKPQLIKIEANEPAGVFNAFQTIRQLLPAGFEQEGGKKLPVTIAGMTIKDYPRFEWRGLMLDVSRHFFTVEEVKQYLDKMSQYKFNVFHWHLTDDEGWRIEIKSLPKLTEVGAWRVPRHGKFGEDRLPPAPGEKPTEGGFYTQEQIKEVIQYAAERNITIVPEIDFPGHSMAALAAYPELSTKKEPKFVNPGAKFSEWYGNGKFKMLIENTLNPADEKVYDFVDKVFAEVAELFPGEYIHMGGDECYHGFWEEDPEVQKFMKKHKIKDSHELQSYFVKRVAKIIEKKGKKMIGWDEILYGGLADGAAVMSWRGMKGGVEAAKQGHKVVMSPTTFAYLDYTQGDHSVENIIYADLSLEKSYSFEPVPEEVDDKYILGGQANLWTEMVTTMPFAFYMTYPRALAIAESVWSPKSHKNWDSFVTRAITHINRFEAVNDNISKAIYDPIVNVYEEDGKLMCSLNNSIPNTEIYYTINNTYPVKFGIKYEEPFELPVGKYALRAGTYINDKPIGRELIINKTELDQRKGKKKFSVEDLFEE